MPRWKQYLVWISSIVGMTIVMILFVAILQAQGVDEPLKIEQYGDGYLYTQGKDSLYVWWMPGGYPKYVRDDSLTAFIKEEGKIEKY